MDLVDMYVEAKKHDNAKLAKFSDGTFRTEFMTFHGLSGKPLAPQVQISRIKDLLQEREQTAARLMRIDVLISDLDALP